MALLLVYSDSNAIDQDKYADSFDSISLVVLAQIPNGRHARKKLKRKTLGLPLPTEDVDHY